VTPLWREKGFQQRRVIENPANQKGQHMVEKWKPARKLVRAKHAGLGGDDPQIVLRRILLNSLMKAPVPKEKVIASATRQFGFTREDVLRAAIWWNCAEEMRDGEAHWRKPDVLVALPHWPHGRGGVEESGKLYRNSSSHA
jgi:hypothetical protein